MSSAKKGLPSSWYNSLESDSMLGANYEAVSGNGWTVVNAKKAVRGAITWKGEQRQGVFYAAGPRETFEGEWLAAGAVVLMPITNATILESVSSFVRGRTLIKKGEKIEAAIERLGGVGQLAANLGLPWFDTATLQLEVVALDDRVKQLVDAATSDVRAAASRGETKPLEVLFDLPATSEPAIRNVVAIYSALGWSVQVDPPEARTRRWRMSRT